MFAKAQVKPVLVLVPIKFHNPEGSAGDGITDEPTADTF